ncbi:MAG TPA: hypothetical protein VFS32_03270 [Candidatus Limnocylindrales bacterium]|nr:hypothetical protein [Candidatus Limnocylindrales bacterium]
MRRDPSRSSRPAGRVHAALAPDEAAGRFTPLPVPSAAVAAATA